MRFAQRIFLAAGIYGLLVMPPMYFMERQIGIDSGSDITHPEFYYGFLGVVFAFQVAFLVIAYDPPRFRPFMIPAMIEKFSFVMAIAVLYAVGRGDEILSTIPFAAALDAVFGVLFVVAWVKTGED